MSKRRVVVTGMGIVCPVGVGVSNAWPRLLAGESGIRRLDMFDTSEHAVKIGGQVWDFSADEYLDPRDAKRMDPFTQYAVAASIEAMNDSGLDMSNEDPTRVACILGTGIGGLTEQEAQTERRLAKGPRVVSPLVVPKMMVNAHSGLVALHHGLKGPNYSTGSACASATHAIGVSLRTIVYGDADVVVSGGSESAISPLSLAGFGNMKALSRRNDDPAGASRPFDKGRDGFVMGDGGAVVVLEELERAKARGAKVYAELLGFGSTDDAYHLTAPDATGDGPRRAMELCLADGGIAKDDVGYINAHGTSTELNDKTETLAIKQVFGDHAKKLMISSTKSMVGHLLGASGAVEFVATCMGISEGRIHPTINYEEPDPDCDLDYVPNEAREVSLDYAISNSFGFGGTNACLAIRRYA